MKFLLTMIALVGCGAWFIKDTPLAEQLHIHLVALKRHAVQVAAEHAAASAQQQQTTTDLYAAVDLFQDTGLTGVRRIPKGTQIYAVTMEGDQITVTDGQTILVTTPSAITDIKPAARQHSADSGPGFTPIPPLPGSIEAPRPPVDPRNASTQARIDELDQQIKALRQVALSTRSVRSAQASLEIDRLRIQRANLERRLY